MTALIVIGAVAALILLLLLLPLGVRAEYSGAGAEAYLLIGFISLRLYPSKEKKSEKKKKKPQKTEKQKEEKPQKGGGHLSFDSILLVAGELIKKLLLTLRVRTLYVFMTIPGSDDPADAAINFGKSQAAIGLIKPILTDRVRVKDLRLETNVDYLLEKTEIYAKLVIVAPLWRLLSLGITVLKLYLKYFKKGGARNGQASNM